MLRRLLLLLLLVPGPALAEGVLDKVRATGILEAGTRAEAIPFAFRRDDGSLVGFSVDLLEAIRARLERVLGRPVQLHLTTVTAQNRIPMVTAGTIAIECGITTATWEREEAVDFSIPFFENGTRVLTRRDRAHSLADLKGTRIGVLEASSTESIIRRTLPDSTVVRVDTLEHALDMLLHDQLDGVANVGIVLRAQIEHLDDQSRFVLLPRGAVLSWESLACMLPQNNSPWRDLVNHTISDLLDGVESYSGGWVDLYERWFGVQGEVFYPLDESTAQRLAALRIWLN